MSNTSQVVRAVDSRGRFVQWTLRRNCSMSPQQLLGVLLAVCLSSLGVGLFFWWQGAVLVLPFACAEWLAVAVAFVWHARHATDCDRIRLDPEHVVVEWETAGQTTEARFERHLVRVEPVPQEGLIELRAGSRAVRVGRFLRPHMHPALAREIRVALAGA